MRLALLAIPLMLPFLAIPTSGSAPRPVLGAAAQMDVSPVVLDPSDPARTRVDALTYLGGVRLRSSDPAFGGFSAMHVAGERFTLVSDGGNVVKFRMGADWKARDVIFGDLPAGPGRGWNKAARDSESMTGDPAGRHLWIGFENANQIWRYDSALKQPEARSKPFAMRDWDANGGAEAMVRMADGSFIMLSETSTFPHVRGTAAIRFDGDPTNPRTIGTSFGFRAPPGGFAVSDAAQLPDGRLLVLVRRVSLNRWFEAKLVLLDPSLIKPGVSLAGREIAAFTIPVTRDNFEALAVVREGNDTILWIASDDNGFWLEKSLLMKFRLTLPD